MAVSNCTNGAYVAVEALANADDAGVITQSASMDDLTSADFMENLKKILAKFGGSIEAIEAFLKNYLAGHQTGSVRDHMTTESVLSLKGLEDMVGQLKDYDSQMSAVQAKIDQTKKDTLALTDQLTSVTEEASRGYEYWLNYYLLRGGFLCIFAAAGLAGLKLGQLAQDAKNIGDQIAAKGNDVTTETAQLGSLLKSQLAITAGATGRMSGHASALSGPAQSMMDTVKHLLALGFSCVDALDNSNNN